MKSAREKIQYRSLPFQVLERPGGVVLKRGTEQLLIEGELALESILLLLSVTSGTSATEDEICSKFAQPDHPNVRRLIELLYQKRFLVAADRIPGDLSEDNADIFYWQHDRTRQSIVDKLSELSIAIAGINPLTHHIHASLTAMGVTNICLMDDPLLRSHSFFKDDQINPQAWTGSLPAIIPAQQREEALKDHRAKCLIAATAYGGQVLLLEWNRLCIDKQIDFMPVNLQDMIGYAGPLVIPDKTACLQCLRMRQNAHLHDVDLERLAEQHAHRGQSIAAIHPSMITVLADTAVFELTHFYGNLADPRPGRLIRIDLAAGTTDAFPVLKIPRCPVCSKLNKMAAVKTRKLNPMP